MAIEEKDDTLETLLEEDDQNTESDLEDNQNTEPDTEDNQGEGKGDIESPDINWDAIDDETFTSMNQAQMSEFLKSGKLPDGSIPVKSGSKDKKDVDTRTDDGSAEGSDNVQDSTGDNPQESKPGSGTSKKTGQKEGDNAHPQVRKQSTQDGKGKTSKQTDGQQGHRETSAQGQQIDYKGAYERIFAPFKANGKEIAPKTPEDVISLMQMGANYTKKMQVMAPLRKTVESLNRANIDENSLNFLIDLHNGDTEAIKQLLSKHKIDPLELNLEDNNYVPRNNMVSDEDAAYIDTLEDIREHLPKVQNIINNTWDADSRTIILQDKKLIRALAEELEMGRFEIVQAKLEEEKTFGRYKDKSDVEAYIDLVNRMIAEQQMNESPTSVSPKPTNTPKKIVPDKSKAAPTKAKAAPQQESQMTAKDLFQMSDEEFLKMRV